ncbi:hypothetical protein TRVA0_011S01816 [Trichomonascus vanleenenianus]|uniref:uncharacterized protein n=1 Tax=Trichomonascus vanleenenianus TaxID=2268995 RepID=UPI003EC9A396
MKAEAERLAMRLQRASEENTTLLQTNADLLQQSFEIQQALDFSDCLVESLTKNLEKVRVELRQLSRTSCKTQRLENHIALLEATQEALENELNGSARDKRFLESRVMKSQREVRQLTLQMDALEAQLTNSAIRSPTETPSMSTSPTHKHTLSIETGRFNTLSRWEGHNKIPSTPTPISYPEVVLLGQYALQGTPIQKGVLSDESLQLPPTPPNENLSTPPSENLAPMMAYNKCAQTTTGTITATRVNAPTIKNKASSRDLLLKAAQGSQSMDKRAAGELETEPYFHSVVDDLSEALDTVI